MLRLGIALIALLALNAGFVPRAPAAQGIEPAQVMDAEVEKHLTAPDRKPVLHFTLNDNGRIDPAHAAGTNIREIATPYPTGATPKPFGPLIVFFYEKPGASHCYSYWNSSKWTEVCPQH